MRKSKLKGGEEYDAVSRYWKNVIIWQRHERKRIKQRINRRERRTTRQSIRKEE